MLCNTNDWITDAKRLNRLFHTLDPQGQRPSLPSLKQHNAMWMMISAYLITIMFMVGPVSANQNGWIGPNTPLDLIGHVLLNARVKHVRAVIRRVRLLYEQLRRMVQAGSQLSHYQLGTEDDADNDAASASICVLMSRKAAARCQIGTSMLTMQTRSLVTYYVSCSSLHHQYTFFSAPLSCVLGTCVGI